MAIRLVLPIMFALAVVALAACSESPPLDPEPTAQDATTNTPRIAFHSNRRRELEHLPDEPRRLRPDPPDR